jgi:hypothetical protein
LTIYLAVLHIPGPHDSPTYTGTRVTKEKFKYKHWSVCLPLGIQPKTKNWILHHCNGYLQWHKCHYKERTRRRLFQKRAVRTKFHIYVFIILMCLLSALRNLFLNYWYIFYQPPKPGVRDTVALVTPRWCESDVD